MSFGDKVQAFAKKAIFESEKQFRKKTFQLYIDIVDGTPRITGTLRVNWQFSTKLNPVKNTKGKGKNFSSGDLSQSKMQAAANNSKLKLMETAIIFNNMEYAEAVEKGIGPGVRKPRRMVARAIEKMKIDAGIKP